jgi:transposase
MKTPPIKRIDLEMDEIQALLERARASMDPADYAKLEALVETAVYLLELVEDKRTTIHRLRKLLFGSCSEKIRDVLKTTGDDAEGAGGQETATEDGVASSQDADQEPGSDTQKPKGHGRNGADAYRGAEKIQVTHGSLKSGDACPDCKKGKVYEMDRPGVLVRIVGQAPVQAKVYELQKLRCNLCGKVFTAPTPDGVGAEKYDATSASMIALLKYGSGLPFNRLEGLQGNLGLPLPASTQWDIVNATARQIQPAYEELIRQAAQGEVLHNDDTTIKILEFMGKRAKQAALAEDGTEDSAKKNASQRSGLFTSGIVSTHAGRRIALFFTGRKHAGENLATVLGRRAEDLGPPIQMCDALSRNLPAELQTIVANCLAHARRQFVDVAENFPEACRHVLERLGEVYRNDAAARAQNLSPAARLAFHQAESGPIMAALYTWLTRQFEDRLVEPNSSLGQAIAYLLRHWEKLTLFLREPGAPLDNNICERALKRAILHRKNALFYKTEHGARVGDLFMSLIHTCQLNDTDPFDYLTTLQRQAESLASNPSKWMPWNYRDALASIATPTSSSP